MFGPLKERGLLTMGLHYDSVEGLGGQCKQSEGQLSFACCQNRPESSLGTGASRALLRPDLKVFWGLSSGRDRQRVRERERERDIYIYIWSPPPPRSTLKGLAIHLLTNKYIIASARTAENTVNNYIAFED